MTIGPPPTMAPYPFAQLDEAKANAIARGVDVIDFGMGDPRDPTPAFIREALVAGIDPVSQYPRAAGLPELRAAIARWVQRRFGATLDADRAVLPTLGSKEIIHSLPAYLLSDERPLVVVPTPAYPVYERGTTFHGGEVHPLALDPRRGFLPDLDAVPTSVWQRTALLWLNFPNNPTGATAPMALYEQAADLAREHGFVLASDEAYSEIWFRDPPTSALQLPSHARVLVCNTLSKRSCMTGYRSGFLAGDPELIGQIRAYRPSVGVTPQDFVQRAAVAAWDDEDHVDSFRASWRAKRDVVLDALQAIGLEARNDATFFLWVRAPLGTPAPLLAKHWLGAAGIMVTPGGAFGDGGEGHVRLALVPTLEACSTAADRLRRAGLPRPMTT